MDIRNLTPFRPAHLAGRVGFPGHSLTVIVKATFSLGADGAVRTADDQLSVTGDEPHPDDDEGIGSLRYESDFAWFKPHADLLLVGKCHPAQATDVCRVTFGVGNQSRSLAVIGDRFFVPRLLGAGVTDPAPFAAMDLRWENAFGGEGFTANPVGKGMVKRPGPDGRLRQPLPNIEAIGALVDSPSSRPAPAGFGPVPRAWPERSSKLGTYKGHWRKTRWPWFADDLDPTYFNAAPAPMQMATYLRGDEELRLENLHPDVADYRARLPGLRVRCFLDEEPGPGSDGFREVKMQIDTLWVDTESRTLVLVWRGVAAVRSEEQEEVRNLLVLAEPMANAPRSLAECRAELAAALAANAAPAEAEPGEPAVEAPAAASEGAAVPATDPPANAKSPEPESDPELDKALAEAREALRKVGVDPENPPPLPPEGRRHQARFMLAAGLTVPDLLASGIQAADIPVDSEAERKAIAELREKMGIEPPEPPAAPTPTPEAGPEPLTRASFAQRLAAGQSFAGVDLRSLDLAGIDASGADLQGAILARVNLRDAVLVGAILQDAHLQGADLRGANLTRAVLSGAGLAGSVLSGANLTEADFSGVKASDADFTAANLTGAVGEGAELHGSRLDRAMAKGASLAGANLRGASLAGVDLSQADLTGAVFDDAKLQRAKLENANASGMLARRADFQRADLTGLRASDGADFGEANLREVVAVGALFEKSMLRRADLSYAKLEGAQFVATDLTGANLAAADLRTACLRKARLPGARLLMVNLFEACLDKADLRGADLGGANLFGAELLDAQLDEAILDGANLQRTKLA